MASCFLTEIIHIILYPIDILILRGLKPITQYHFGRLTLIKKMFGVICHPKHTKTFVYFVKFSHTIFFVRLFRLFTGSTGIYGGVIQKLNKLGSWWRFTRTFVFRIKSIKCVKIVLINTQTDWITKWTVIGILLNLNSNYIYGNGHHNGFVNFSMLKTNRWPSS